MPSCRLPQEFCVREVTQPSGNRPPFLYTRARCAHRTFSFLPGTYSLKKMSSFPNKPRPCRALHRVCVGSDGHAIGTFTPPCSATGDINAFKKGGLFQRRYVCPLFGVKATVFLGLTVMSTLARAGRRKDTTSDATSIVPTLRSSKEDERFSTSWLEILSVPLQPPALVIALCRTTPDPWRLLGAPRWSSRTLRLSPESI